MSTDPPSNEGSSQSSAPQGSSQSGTGAGAGSEVEGEEESEEGSGGKQMDCTTALIFNRTRRELSRLLIEKLPMEILKRMVIRWPVGEEQYQDRSALNAKRLAMTMWDLSGDPVQASYAPFFFSDRCLFVTTYDLSRNLDQASISHRKRSLCNVDGSVPTNAQVLESWLGAAVAFTKRTPSEPFRCTGKTPLLPPVILACTHSDHPSLEVTPSLFHNFFHRKSFGSYQKHLVEARSPSAVRLSNRYETSSTRSEVELEVPYSGHDLLRREIEYLARQLPYFQDNVPVQWVKFEQLIYGLQQQKKLLLLYGDLARYIAEHCQLSGPLQILPVLSHFHDLGIIVHFYRHPELCRLVITRPQWLVSALGSIVTSSPSRWVTQEVQNGFKKLGQVGSIEKEMLLLAYRCARMGQKYWNEMLFILNCMDLLTCHPSLHDSKSVYMPAMVTQPPPEPYVALATSGQCGDNPLPIYFQTSEGSAFPIALFNQLLVRCIRASQYSPVLYYKLAHFKLNSTHHLLLWLEHTSVAVLIQPVSSSSSSSSSSDSNDAKDACNDCNCGDDDKKSTKHGFERKCSSIEHLIGEDVELLPTENIFTLIQSSTTSGIIDGFHLVFSDDTTLEELCPAVLSFLQEHLQFLCNCWFPGLDLDLANHHRAAQGERERQVTVLDQFWNCTVLQEGKADERLSVWFT